MATPTIIVLVGVAVLTVVVVIVVILVMIRRLTAIAQEVADLEQRLAPALETLQRDADLTGQELERVSAALDALARARRRDG